MKEISTEIIINASAAKVWSVFINFAEYPKWNPFIISAEGRIALGSHVKVKIKSPDSNEMTFNPKIIVYKEQQELQWSGRLLFPGLFDGRHIFKIVDNGNKAVTFMQQEVFTGIFVPLYSKMLDTSTKKGYVLMNEKLKEVCEKG
jgi:hypothetical protein